MNSSTVVPSKRGFDLQSDFQINPVGFRVVLPNGSLAVVKEFIDDKDGRLFRVQGVKKNGQYCKLPKGVKHWYSASELMLQYWNLRVKA